MIVGRLAVYLSLLATCLSFSPSLPSHGRSCRASHRSETSLAPLRASETTEEVESDKKTAQLRLVGKANLSSFYLPMKGGLEEFFNDQDTLKLLLSGGGIREIESLEATSALVDQWKAATKSLEGAVCPDNTDNLIFRVKTGGMDFPGLHVDSVSNIGAKMVPNPDTGLSDIQVTMINDETSVSGLPPVVWIYNKLTGANSEGGSNTQTSSFTKVSCDVKDNGTVGFVVEGDLVVTINFPALLLKIIPGNKETAEKNGAASIEKLLYKDLETAMKALEEKYEAMTSEPME